jgi:hypothetical protein
MIVRNIQEIEFADEIDKIKKCKLIKKSSTLNSLAPFIDQQAGLLKVGGRLKNASIATIAKHPTILPAKNPFTNLIFMHYHQKELHAGPQMLFNVSVNVCGAQE